MNRKVIIVSSIILILCVLAVVVYAVSNKRNTYEDFMMSSEDNSPKPYDPNKEREMLDKVLAVIDNYRDELSDVGVETGGITEEMISYSSDTSRVTVIFPCEYGDVYLWLHFDESGNVIEYSITLPGDSDDNPDAG